MFVSEVEPGMMLRTNAGLREIVNISETKFHQKTFFLEDNKMTAPMNPDLDLGLNIESLTIWPYIDDGLHLRL